MQRGSALPFVLIGILLIGFFSVLFYYNKPETDRASFPRINVNKSVPKDNFKTYANDFGLGFEFKYPKGFIAKIDNEDAFNKRGNGDFRKNFSSFVGYESAKVLGAVTVLGMDNNFDTAPFSVWVFENSNDLTPEGFFNRFWYYPFVWGDFDPPTKNHIFPKDEATVSGQLAKSAVIYYQPNKPKMVYLSLDNKMYLFKIIGQDGENILSSFKMLENKVSIDEKQKIDNWILKNNLNEFGDSKDILYTGGTPLFDETTGQRMDKYDYIIQKHPDKPWNK